MVRLPVVVILPAAILVNACAGCSNTAALEQARAQHLEAIASQNQHVEQETQKLIQQSREVDASVARIESARLTPEQEQNAKLMSEVYYTALAKTISQIDDLSSPPEVIARAAVSANHILLVKQMEAHLVHLIEASPTSAKAVRLRLAQLPSEMDINDALYMVMRIRAGKKEMESEVPKLRPYQGPPAEGNPAETTI